MSLKVEYKGVDITGSIEVERCWLDQYAEEHGDTIKIVFRDIKRLWDIWSPEIDDEIDYSTDDDDFADGFAAEDEDGLSELGDDDFDDYDDDDGFDDEE